MTDFELRSFLANLILESKYEMMDISIKQLSKEINTEEKIRNFLEDNIEIQSKEDGIKCTLIHTANTGDYKRDWIVAYKGTIIYPSEVDKFGDIDKVEKEGYSLVPVKLYLNDGRAKILLGIARGKKLYDKRQSLKEKDIKREMEKNIRY